MNITENPLWTGPPFQRKNDQGKVELMKERVNFSRNAEISLKNKNLQRNLDYSLTLSNKKRNELVETFPEWEEMRSHAAQLRTHVVENLEKYLREFSDNATQKGLQILWAKDATRACELIAGTLREHHVSRVVKSKSMLTEEIDLNNYLSKQGITPIETDLGEYIAQIASQKPSHITAPISHLSRQEVASIMSENLGIRYTEDPAELTSAARRILRSSFLSAEAGISGTNFGLAREGSLVVVENEGNARLSISLPPIHIAVMGIERVLPGLADLPLLLTLLTVSATGQRISNYVSIINSPSKQGEPDGPEKVFIVLVDNGRTEILRNVKYRPILNCIRCGACLNICPVYRKVGGHAYGSVYPGPLGAVLSPVLFSRTQYRDLPYASTLCGACTEVCPVKIPLHHLLLDLRADNVQSSARPTVERIMFSIFGLICSRPRLYRGLEKIIRCLQPLIRSRDGGLFIPGWSKTRYFPGLAPQSFHAQWQSEKMENNDISL